MANDNQGKLVPTLTNDAQAIMNSQVQGFNPTALAETGSLAAAQGLQEIGSAASEAGSSLAILGPIGAVAGAVLGPIINAINAHHAAAVAHEAALLNAAVPEFMKTLQQILAAYNAGLDAASTYAYIDQAVTDYYTNVNQGGSGKIEGHWPFNCAGDTSPQPHGCNGPCTVGHWEIEAAACEAKGVIAQAELGNPGTAQFCINSGCPPHAGYQGFGPWSVYVAKPSGATAALSSLGLSTAWTSLSTTGKLVAVAALLLAAFAVGGRVRA